ncbi:hypothetical protein LOD99_2703 [Oopsacas minuta]|uniref:RNA transcription, translation and transport factor protein n=1 Tax=Oopsacas minuta TaxID=111878 RepID=A0AAV7K0S1_9METZ|nr:hypothetical protein LOD99_2703 [Oopsacas minuta]
MYTRRLKALGYLSADKFKTNISQVQQLVIWLEDNKIRYLPIENRESLKATEFKDFKRALNSYLSGLGCPFEMKDIDSVMTWLLGRAIRSEYTEVLQEYPELNTAEFKGARAKRRAEAVPADDYRLPLPSVDHPEFKQMVNQLCNSLMIPAHDDLILRLQAAAHLIGERDKLENSKIDKSRKSIGLTPQDLGFDFGDAALDQAAMGLRLLHQSELRNLQTRINEIIVKVQSVTADPRTDERLGRVGK